MKIEMLTCLLLFFPSLGFSTNLSEKLSMGITYEIVTHPFTLNCKKIKPLFYELLELKENNKIKHSGEINKILANYNLFLKQKKTLKKDRFRTGLSQEMAYFFKSVSPYAFKNYGVIKKNYYYCKMSGDEKGCENPELKNTRDECLISLESSLVRKLIGFSIVKGTDLALTLRRLVEDYSENRLESTNSIKSSLNRLKLKCQENPKMIKSFSLDDSRAMLKYCLKQTNMNRKDICRGKSPFLCKIEKLKRKSTH